MKEIERMWAAVEPEWRENPPQLCAFPPYPCSYLPGRAWQLLGIHDVDIDRLMHLGGQRFGSIYCLPLCVRCRACRPARISIADFQLSRSQKRTLKRNTDLTVKIEKADWSPQKFEVFERFVVSKFGTKTDQLVTVRQRQLYYESWLIHRPDRTQELSYWLGDRLLAVSTVDVGERGLYSHYLYYDLTFPKRRLGIYTFLKEIQWCSELGFNYLYIGFSNPKAKTMRYKDQFSGLQVLLPDRGWVPKPEEDELA